MKKTHFIALVPMGGSQTGRIAQHAAPSHTHKAAAEWARQRFTRPAAIVEMPANKLSLGIEAGEKLYLQLCPSNC